MGYVTGHWSFDPLLVLAAVTVLVHELGLRHLAARSEPAHRARRRRRAWLCYAGLAVVVLAVDSPIDYWGYRYFFVHMIEHILFMFFGPILIVAGSPWVPLVHSLPVSVRRRVGRWVAFGPAAGALRRLWRVVRSPWTALIAVNAAMVVWHLPPALDLAQRTAAVHVWGMLTSFFVAGVLFWLQIIPSRPLRRLATRYWQIGAIVATNVVMLVLAMALSIFTRHSWYPAYEHVPGVGLSPFSDQQIGAAILWICGDFWAVPVLAWLVRRAIDEHGSVTGIVDELVLRASRAATGPNA